MRRGWDTWIKARLRLRAGGFQRVRFLDTWSDSFTPEELAALQYPWEGNPAEKRQAVDLQREMARRLHAAIRGGEIEAAGRLVVAVPAAMRTLLMELDLCGEGTTETPLLTGPVFAAWLRSCGISPSGEIQAWLAAGEVGKRKPEEKTKQKLREAVLQAWLDGPGRVYIERDKLTLTKLQAWGQLEKKSGEFQCDATKSLIDDFFKKQRLVRFKQGRRD